MMLAHRAAAGSNSRSAPGAWRRRPAPDLLTIPFIAMGIGLALLATSSARAEGGPATTPAPAARTATPATPASLDKERVGFAAGLGSSGLPLPRFVSLKSDRVNLRQGPGTDYPTAWVYRRAGLPVEVIEEFESWRKVRDAEGTTGWILSSLLSGRRTALVLPWEVKGDAPRPQVALQADQRGDARAVALVEAGVVADVHGCNGQWCDVTVDTYRGYVEQVKLWGVYKSETVK